MSHHTVLITGGLGFIGSHFIEYYQEKHPEDNIINLDKVTYAASENLIDEWKHRSNYKFIKGDICNEELINYIFEEFHPNKIIHFAAESHVDNSIKNASAFIKTNVYGTYVLLNAALKTWKSQNQREYRFHHISTDEVYGSLGETGYFTEESKYEPNSPYSASKASSDMIVRSFFQTHKLNAVITNCSNNFGPRQHPEKLIPTIIRKALSGESIPIYGDGKNVRDWLYVKDHCQAIYKVLMHGTAGETYNIGGDCEWENIQLAEKICLSLDEINSDKKTSYTDQIKFVEDRLGHDRRYAIDCTKIKENLSWSQITDFNEALRETISWYRKNHYS